MFELLSAPSFFVTGCSCLLGGAVLLLWRGLFGTLEIANFLLSVGLGILAAGYLARGTSHNDSSRLLFLSMTVLLGALLYSQQDFSQRVKGRLTLGNQSVETMDIQHGGSRVPYHLGAPLGMVDQNRQIDDLPSVTFGLDGPQKRYGSFTNSQPRIQLGPWTLERLARVYQEGGLRVGIAAKNETGTWFEHRMNPGTTITISDKTTLRVMGLTALADDQGHRIFVEVIHNGERFYRMLYDEAPRLDEALDANAPQLRVTGVEHVPAHEFLVYESQSLIPIWIGLTLAFMLLATAALRRGRT